MYFLRHGSILSRVGASGKPGAVHASGKEFADLIVRYGDELIIFSEKSKNFLENIDLEIAWSRWSKIFDQGAKQIFGAERNLLLQNAELFIDPRCRRKAPAQLTSQAPSRIFRVLVARGAGLAAQSFFQSATASLAMTSIRSGEKPEFPFSFNPFFEPGRIVHVLDDFTLPVLFRLINTAPDLFEYLRKKEGLLNSIEAFTCHGEEELIKHYLTNIDPEGGHGFHKITKTASDQAANMVVFDEDTYSEFSASEAIMERLRLDEPSYVVDKFIDYMHETLLRSDHASELRVEKALRKLAESNRVERRLIGRLIEEFVKIDHAGPILVRSMMRGDTPALCEKAIILISIRFENPASAQARIADPSIICNEIGKAYVAMLMNKYHLLTEFIVIWFMKDDRSERRLHSEDIGYISRSDFGGDEFEKCLADAKAFGLGEAFNVPTLYSQEEYGASQATK